MDAVDERSTDNSGLPYAAEITRYVTIVTCFVSIFCGVLLLILVGRHRLGLGSCHFMFVGLTIADIFTAGGNLVGVFRQTGDMDATTDPCNSTSVCVAQSFTTTWSSMVTFLWTIVIEIFCSWVIWNNHRYPSLPRWIKVIVTVPCWLLPLLITSAALWNGVLGQDESKTSAGWCWIISCESLSVHARITWMLFTGKLWEILSYLTIANLILLSLVKLYYRISEQRHRSLYATFDFWEDETCQTVPIQSITGNSSSSGNSGSSEEDAEFHKRKLLFWIPVCLILARIWGTIRFFINVYEIAHDGSPPEIVLKIDSVLLCLQGIGDSSQALWNFVLVIIFNREAVTSFFRWSRRVDTSLLTD